MPLTVVSKASMAKLSQIISVSFVLLSLSLSFSLSLSRTHFSLSFSLVHTRALTLPLETHYSSSQQKVGPVANIATPSLGESTGTSQPHCWDHVTDGSHDRWTTWQLDHVTGVLSDGVWCCMWLAGLTGFLLDFIHALLTRQEALTFSTLSA